LRIAGRRILPTPNGFFARWQTLEAQRSLRLRNVVPVFLSSGAKFSATAPPPEQRRCATQHFYTISLSLKLVAITLLGRFAPRAGFVALRLCSDITQT
jgi:hypothetical protein